MAPQITNWDSLSYVSEEWDPKTRQFLYTSFLVIDETDTLYYGRLNALKATALPANVHIKRPALDLYEPLRKHNQLHQLHEMLLVEAQVLEMFCPHRYPHPNIIRYHSCRVVRGYITGLVMDKHPHNLETYLKDMDGDENGIGKPAFMDALESAARHLHALGYARNGRTPANILVDANGMPVLIDLGGCQPVGSRLKYIRGTKGWIDGEIEDYTTSDERMISRRLRRSGRGLMDM